MEKMSPEGALFLLGTVAFVSLFLFLICREVVCWYWKINYGIELLEKIHAQLQRANGGYPSSDEKKTGT